MLRQYQITNRFLAGLSGLPSIFGILSGGSLRSPPATIASARRAFFIHLGIHH
jgi:hypothetical protein